MMSQIGLSGDIDMDLRGFDQRARIAELETELAETRGALNSLQSAYDKLLSRATDVQQVAAVFETLPDLSQAHFRHNARIFWTKADYQTEKRRRGEGTSLEGDVDSTSLWFVVDQNGNTVPRARIDGMREWAKAIWETMFQSKTAPEVWSRRDSKNWLLYELSMCLRYPELNYCATPERWKCHEIGTIDYSSWLAARRKAEAKAEEKKRKREAATAAKQNPSNDDAETARTRKRGRTTTAQPPPGQVIASESSSSNITQAAPADALTTAASSHRPALQPVQPAAGSGATSSAPSTPSTSVTGPLPVPNPPPGATTPPPPSPSPPPQESSPIPPLPLAAPIENPLQPLAPTPLSSDQPGPSASDQLPATAPVSDGDTAASLLGLLRRGDQLRADALGGMVLPHPLPAAETTRPPAPGAQPESSAGTATVSGTGAASGAPGAPPARATRKGKPTKMAVMPEGTQQLRSIVMRHFLTTHPNGPDRVPQDEWLAHWAKHEKDVQYLEPFRAQLTSAKRAKRADASSG
ncbi:hypothetical protein EXIGLDRAFT_734975 [Exidia glandulosa HHB12029]|uniref:Uncharacterized protein n=1 Tax=Exidia glandulosa HHB12029 TaxID=1314781 RepID=A0A165AWM5_EXIGL|nr:hypothetical protein EXIGLDRAFT_734975 [Exidia glandulosa HHB12029]